MGDRIEITWKAFLLRVAPTHTSREKFVEYTRLWQRPAAMEPSITFTTWASDDPPPSSSVPAHVAAKVVADVAPSRYLGYHHRLLRAYFTENRDISSWEVLRTLAGELAVDLDAYDTRLASGRDELTRLVYDEHNGAIDREVTAVPTVVIDGRLPVPGAQDVDTYQIWIERILARRQPGADAR